MNDKAFLVWLHERLEHVHKEDPAADYMHKLRAIIKTTSPTVDSEKNLITTLDEYKARLSFKDRPLEAHRKHADDLLQF